MQEAMPSGGERSIAVLEPGAIGTWVITTETGSRYVLNLTPDGPSTISREPAPRDGIAMRRDLQDVELISWQSHRAALGGDPALLLGDCLLLVLEPLSEGAEHTVRITSAVVAIIEGSVSAGDPPLRK